MIYNTDEILDRYIFTGNQTVSGQSIRRGQFAGDI